MKSVAHLCHGPQIVLNIVDKALPEPAKKEIQVKVNVCDILSAFTYMVSGQKVGSVIITPHNEPGS